MSSSSNSELGCIICGKPSRIYRWKEHSIVACVKHLNEMYDNSFGYEPRYNGQRIGGGLMRDVFYQDRFFQDSEAGALTYLLSFWCSLPEVPDR